MPTPFENQILVEYEMALAGSELMSRTLQCALFDAVSGDKSPTADAILALLKANVGDHSV